MTYIRGEAMIMPETSPTCCCMFSNNGHTPRIKVLIVEEQPLLRRALHDVLTECMLITIIGEVAHVPEAPLSTADRPDVILFDVSTVQDKVAAVAALQEAYPNVPILLFCEMEECAKTLYALHAGVRGYLLKNIPPEVLVQTLYLVAHGYTVMPTALVPPATSTARVDLMPAEGDASPPFTPREWDILRLLAQGYTNRQIAQRLIISESTVKTHVHNMLRKIGVHNRAELAAWALRRQLV